MYHSTIGNDSGRHSAVYLSTDLLRLSALVMVRIGRGSRRVEVVRRVEMAGEN